MTAIGYQVSITLHRDMRYAIITRMPDAVSRTLPVRLLDDFMCCVATDFSVQELERWFDKCAAGTRMNGAAER